jgi:predicted nucleic acid-binding protein
LAPHDIETALLTLERMGVDQVDRGFEGLIEAVRLAAQHHLTVYDALYLALAIHLEGEIATTDQELRRAAIAESVPVV